jgi:hypothetical protein
MKQIVITFLFLSCFFMIAQVGIGTLTPDDDLDVIGDTQVSGFLRVGNPVIPQAVTNTGIQLFSMGGAAYYSGFSQNGCGTIWSGTQTGNDVSDIGVMEYDNVGNRGNQNLVSPHIWVPSIANTVIVEVSHFCTLEAGYDGVYLEYSTDNGGSWNAIPAANFFIGGYSGVTDGSNTTCNGNLNGNTWTGNQGNMVSALFLNITNTWLQFRFVGTEDGSVGTGEYNLLNFKVFTDDFSGGHGGAFAGGNIYAENNIYAGSNVLLGDLAEYFPIVGSAQKGDIISYVNGKNDRFSVATKENDKKIIGIYSSNPTLTLNDPNSGIPVALQGRVPVNVVGEAIEKGDYLTSSNIPGKAMKAQGSSYMIGRALESFSGGSGSVICLVETGWKNLNMRATSSKVNANSLFPAGKQKVRVKNPCITKNSKVFVTFKGNIGGHHWIDTITEGAFDIQLANKSVTAVPFDYFIENAKIIPSALASKVKTNPSLVDQTRGKDQSLINDRKPYLTESSIPTLMGNAAPPTVTDPTKSYVWSPEFGLKEN